MKATCDDNELGSKLSRSSLVLDTVRVSIEDSQEFVKRAKVFAKVIEEYSFITVIAIPPSERLATAPTILSDFFPSFLGLPATSRTVKPLDSGFAHSFRLEVFEYGLRQLVAIIPFDVLKQFLHYATGHDLFFNGKDIVPGTLSTLLPFLKEIAVFFAVIRSLLLGPKSTLVVSPGAYETLQACKSHRLGKFNISLEVRSSVVADLATVDKVSNNRLPREILYMLFLLSGVVVESEAPIANSNSIWSSGSHGEYIKWSKDDFDTPPREDSDEEKEW